MIGIIGAMDEEVNAIIEKMTNVESREKAGMTFNKGTLEGKEAVVVRCGIGKVNAGLCTQILVDDYKIDAVINTGIAGSLKNQIDIGDIVLSSDALYHDMDATGFGYDFGVVPRMESSVFKGDVRLINLAKECCERVNPDINVHIGRVVSGDQFISDKAKKDWINEHFDGYCTEMEGAAIAHAATLNNIPFLIVRAISDKADNSATMDYGEFEKKAIIHSVNLIMEFVKNM
ncbi:5'-methylthioadenosine/adenosylhomocysteine nucleosidase [Falcatimonas sp. MSJ-15]|uniref:5'-methylthioadenosine/adenosylhomocysteine nucleosidase n=1 Tax=Falcatimonas sp. MSJ-15 TaxID=2841515 RepID=UPI001C121184|nr:5'-methylthioadenosine/adenosylhomocysteine nucleosidase [Falcatimonas sp. MSJ-15]MBU5470928.1 5'-methylthioadenosine/adenosylhomocysteine nucleosidase [Falcatimonas sp. MSJ-15]